MICKNCSAGRNDERHLFTCPDCRADVRLVQAWKGLSRPEALETAAPAEEGFVLRVAGAVRQDRWNRRWRRAWLAAAAALLFFFFAGLAHERASKPAATPEDSLAQLASPNILDGLIPN
ncbi:MAG TPA: hypothetical protein VGL03_01280 [Thermoanaerobaculia bacterium]|jgi:anti-sigma factor RsiW